MRSMDSFKDTCPECGCELTMRFFRPIKTNADRIRAMSDEELAIFIRDQIIDRNIGIPTETWLSWLKAPVEEVQDG